MDVICEDCQGRGWVRKRYSEKFRPLQCSTCKGIGRVEVEVPEPPVASMNTKDATGGRPDFGPESGYYAGPGFRKERGK